MNGMNILQAIEKGAGIAASFAPPPYNAILGIVGGLANNTHTTATAQGIDIPKFDLSSISSLIPPEILTNIMDGKTVTITIDGSKVKAAIASLAQANQALADLKSAFSVK